MPPFGLAWAGVAHEKRPPGKGKSPPNAPSHRAVRACNAPAKSAGARGFPPWPAPRHGAAWGLISGRGTVMKIIALASALLAGASLFSMAEAQTRRPAPSYGYVFGEYDHYSGGGTTLNGGGLGAGWRFNRFFAAQVGGQYTRESGVDITNGYIEGLIHLLPSASRVSLYGSIGGAYVSNSINSPLGTVSISRGGYRAGIGAEYWFAPQWSLRAGWHRQNTFAVYDDISVGIGYRF